MTMPNDPFDQLADEQISNPVKSRRKAAQTRAERRQKQALAERDTLYRMWKKWHEERKQTLLAGPHAEDAAVLIEFLERMTIEDAENLIELVKWGPWQTVDEDTQFTVLSIIDNAICYLREREGLFPIDDSLIFSDEELNAFLIIRKLLRRN